MRAAAPDWAISTTRRISRSYIGPVEGLWGDEYADEADRIFASEAAARRVVKELESFDYAATTDDEDFGQPSFGVEEISADEAESYGYEID